MVRFVEDKKPNFSRIKKLLELCHSSNQWANRGPLYDLLKRKYSEYVEITDKQTFTPCANGGIALEAIARVISIRRNKKLRWIGSAFSFQNLGRGYFSDIELIDCDKEGLLNLDTLKQTPKDVFDGIVLVNSFGMHNDFSNYIDFAEDNKKMLIIDNAAGLSSKISDWPWQAFSLHHTKPFGFGEGGLAITPPSAAEKLYELINYGSTPNEPHLWLNNGKISDVSCAFLIDRLEQVDLWFNKYLEQEKRIRSLVKYFNLQPLNKFNQFIPAMSVPFITNQFLTSKDLTKSKKIVFGKYYKPLVDRENSSNIYSQLVNIPTHPDMAKFSDNEILEEITKILN